MKPQAIEGKTIILRQLLESEAEQICNWRNNSDISKFFHRKHIEPADYVKWMREVEADPTQGLYAIVLAANSELLGTLAFTLQKSSEALLGIMIGASETRGKGYGAEAMELISADLASRFGVKKTVVEVFPENTAAVAFYEKLGYKNDMLVMSKSTSI